MVATAARSAQQGPMQEGFEQLTSRRRRRPGWILAGIGLVVVSMLVGVLLFTWTSTTQQRLALNKDITAGHVVTPGDLKVVDVNPDSSFKSVPVSRQGEIVGKAATGPLPDGQLLSLELFRPSALDLNDGKVSIAAPIDFVQLPAGATDGSAVRLYATVGDSDDGQQAEAVELGTARILRLNESSSSPIRIVSLIVDETAEAQVVQAIADNNLRLVLIAES